MIHNFGYHRHKSQIYSLRISRIFPPQIISMHFFPPNNIFWAHKVEWQPLDNKSRANSLQNLAIQSNFGACERLKLLILLSMSYLGGLSKELQFLLKLLIPFVIVLKKGVKVDPTTNGIKKEVEDSPSCNWHQEVVLVSFEIK